MPDRSDADQEGRTLPQTSLTRMIAREEAWRAIDDHRKSCIFSEEDCAARLRTVEISLGRLVGFMIGSGVLGGVAGGLTSTASKLLFQ